MKICVRRLALAWILTLPLSASAAGTDWMASRPNGILLSELSIPGTHDSGALYEPVPGTTKCQDLPIAEQLNAGVRFLDIRCRHQNDAFAIHHGLVYQNASFDDVLTTVFAFLKAHPSETVIMSVKEEYDPVGNTRSFEKTFDTYVAKNPSKWVLGPSIPQLGDVRGKIVLFRRFGAQQLPKGIDASVWPDDAAFTNGKLRVQDRYHVPKNDDKWAAIQALMVEADAGPRDTLYVNFISGVKSGALGIPDIPTVAGDLNRRLDADLAAHPHRRYGILPMDFVNAARCELVIGSASH